ncbi:MAG: SDR family NAD(P)-dependent oxidoreductase [Bacteroidales bacterium]|nr:SDR family NAD(P)-dependent oxidoreductase [Bacteroidales bacterium]
MQNHKLSSTDLTKEFDINVKGTIWMNDAFLPLLKGKKNAATVTVSSGLAFVPLPISPVYCSSKAALHSYTLSLREQLRNTNIKVFELAPPATETELLADFNEEDMKGISTMTVQAMVTDFLKGFSNDKYEICPGQSSQLKFMSRYFPGFILKQMSKTVDRMHSDS